ncbi:MAG: 5'-methylthioadenosine/S-adenosylhomocysteine nucleosidase, partial [Alphaproteobacteria bacterium]
AAGKVNGAALATMMAYAFDCRALVFSGVAGGLNPAKNVGDIIVADKMVQHDYGAMIDGSIKVYHPGDHCIGDRTMDVPIEMRPDVLAKLKAELKDVSFGTILTGDQFLNCETTRIRLFEEFQADAVEMEGGAVAQIAVRFKIPWVVIRCLSDLAGDESHVDFHAVLKEASDKAARVTLDVLKVL